MTGEGKQDEIFEETVELVTAGPLTGLFALLDQDGTPHWPSGILPPLGHWLYCLNRAPHAYLDLAGAMRNAPLLPQEGSGSCRWRSGNVSFHDDIGFGGHLRRTSMIGPLEDGEKSEEPNFVRTLNRYETSKGLAIEDSREFICGSNPGHFSSGPFSLPGRAEWVRTVKPDPVMLIRYSALTFNSHRIHYDRGYCRLEAGFPGLVVQIPLVATLLADLFLRKRPRARLSRFAYRVHSYLFDTHPIMLKGNPEQGGATLWAEGADGRVGMSATIEAAC